MKNTIIASLLLFHMIMGVFFFVSCGETSIKVTHESECSTYEGITNEIQTTKETENAQCKHYYITQSTTSPTCTKDGVKTFTCSVCNDSYTETIVATGKHDYTGKITTSPTCAKDGVKTFTCSVCNDSYTETILATENHNYISKITTMATWAKNGIKTFTCSLCGNFYTQEITVADQRQNVMIFDIYLEMNSLDGVEAEIIWRNNSGKNIKYIHFYATPYNAVNDPVACEITGLVERVLSSTGPHYAFDKNKLGRYPYLYNDGDRSFVNTDEETGKHYIITSVSMDMNTITPIYNKRYLLDEEYSYIFDIKCMWDPIWYNSTIRNVVITKIEVEYMDGTSEVIENPPIWRDIYIKSGL